MLPSWAEAHCIGCRCLQPGLGQMYAAWLEEMHAWIGHIYTLPGGRNAYSLVLGKIMRVGIAFLTSILSELYMMVRRV
jgi:hypothetical protein